MHVRRKYENRIRWFCEAHLDQRKNHLAWRTTPVDFCITLWVIFWGFLFFWRSFRQLNVLIVFKNNLQMIINTKCLIASWSCDGNLSTHSVVLLLQIQFSKVKIILTDLLIHFYKILEERQYYRDVPLGSFHLNGHTRGFHPRTKKLEPNSEGCVSWVKIYLLSDRKGTSRFELVIETARLWSSLG